MLLGRFVDRTGTGIDISGWSFLAGTWEVESPDGQKEQFRCELNEAKTAYVLSSPSYQGTLGIDPSSERPLLSIGYHPGAGYSVGHFQRISNDLISGGFWLMDREGNRTEHTSRWDKSDHGFTYTIDEANVFQFRRQ